MLFLLTVRVGVNHSYLKRVLVLGKTEASKLLFFCCSIIGELNSLIKVKRTYRAAKIRKLRRLILIVLVYRVQIVDIERGILRNYRRIMNVALSVLIGIFKNKRFSARFRILEERISVAVFSAVLILAARGYIDIIHLRTFDSGISNHVLCVDTLAYFGKNVGVG